MLFFAQSRIEILGRAAVDRQQDGSILIRSDFILDAASPSLDVAAFGRMFAAASEIGTQAAIAVSHAATTHQMALTSDYFSAIDDASAESHAGAGPHRYGLLHLRCVLPEPSRSTSTNWRRSWSSVDTEGAAEDLSDLIRALILALPTGRMSNSNAHTQPLLVLAEEQKMRVAYEFDTPVIAEGDGGYKRGSVTRLAEQRRLAQRFDPANVTGAILAGQPYDEDFADVETGRASTRSSTSSSQGCSASDGGSPAATGGSGPVLGRVPSARQRPPVADCADSAKVGRGRPRRWPASVRGTSTLSTTRFDLHVRVDRANPMATDFQVVAPLPGTVKARADRAEKIRQVAVSASVPSARNGGNFPTGTALRGFLPHCEFLVTITTDDDTTQQWLAAFKEPVFMPYLGRKANAPAYPFVLGTSSLDPITLLSGLPRVRLSHILADVELSAPVRVYQVLGDYYSHSHIPLGHVTPPENTREGRPTWVSQHLSR
ncbi:MAG: type I-E CRISPR-associated protein Cas7/Cse4/CasC [Nocardioidaceae bacterium]